MTRSKTMTKESIPPERLAEAGVWIARLHGDERGPAVEAGFRKWLQANAMNAWAFELATEVWEDSENLRRIIPFAPAPAVKRRSQLNLTVTVSVVATVLITIFTALYVRPGGVATGVGEQRMLTLEDGTRVYLNTETQVVVRYEKSVRRVELKTGEALFEVAKRHAWPFIVTAGNKQVRALGTSFVVRRDAQEFAVTLVEGTVTVSPVDAGTDVANERSGEVETLAPGQRLTFAGNVARIDTPSLDKAIAWRRGQVVLDDTTLSNAVAEMNRYNGIKLVIERPEASRLLVNGLFQAGDSISFANAVAQTYALKVVEHQNELVLSGIPNTGERRPP